MTMSAEGIIIESMFRIADKHGNDVDFILNPVQKEIDRSITGRDLYPKARQEGVSSYFLARYTVCCMSKRNTRAVVISHDNESTQRMLLKVKYFIEHIRGPKPVISNNSANEMIFPKMNSMFYIGTAGSRKFGRGDTISHLHCSEYAFWPNPLQLIAGLFQAVPASGEIAIESTGNGMNDYAQRCLRSAKGNSRYALHFFNWQDFPEYTDQLTEEEEQAVLDTLGPELEEDKLVPALTAGQISWRRGKLEESNYDLRAFKQEYPMTLDECFQSSGNSIFHKVLFQPTDAWVRHDEWLNSWVLKGHPHPDYMYIIGGDVAAGVEQDSSALEVICLNTMEQVGEYDSNKISPDEFADEVAKWGYAYNLAYVIIENNNHGLVTLDNLQRLDENEDPKYPLDLIHTSRLTQARGGVKKSLIRMGVQTTARSKPLMVGQLRSKLSKELIIHSQLLMNQLSTFIEKESGELGAEDGCHDDLVMASACAVIGMERGAIEMHSREPPAPLPKKDPFSFEEIIKELRGKGNSFPIPPQHFIGSKDV